MYTYSKGNLSSSQRTNGSGVSQTCNFKRRHHQHPAGGDDGWQAMERSTAASLPMPTVTWAAHVLLTRFADKHQNGNMEKLRLFGCKLNAKASTEDKEKETTKK